MILSTFNSYPIDKIAPSFGNETGKAPNGKDFFAAAMKAAQEDLPVANNNGATVNDGSRLKVAEEQAQAETSRFTDAQKAELKEAADAFEAIFLRQMLKTMRSATPGDTLFDNQGTQQFRDMSDEKLADNMAQTQGFGISEMLLKQFGVNE